MLKKIGATVALTALVISNMSIASAANFPNGVMWDVDKGHSLYRHMDKMVNEGIVSVYPNGSFHSEEKVSRYQAARYIYNALRKAGSGLVTPKNAINMPTANPFPDVPVSDFYAFYVSQLKNAGLINGYQNGTYGGSNALTRGEMLAVLEKARARVDKSFLVPNLKGSPSLMPTPHRFEDVAMNNTFFNYIYTALGHGYITPNPKFRTNDYVTKAEMSAMLNNILYTPVLAIGGGSTNEQGGGDGGDYTPGDTGDNTNNSGVFYKGPNMTFTSEVKPVSRNKFALIVQAKNITPTIPYINKNILHVTVDGNDLPVSKVTLLKVVDGVVIYGVYVPDYDVNGHLEASYTDSYSTIYASTAVSNPDTGDTGGNTGGDTGTGSTDSGSGSTSGNTGTGSTTPSEDTGDLTVSLAENSPIAGNIPSNASGVKLATYDFTARGGDVTIERISVKRSGLSDQDTISSIAIFDKDGRISRARDDSQENKTTAVLHLLDPIKIKAGDTKEISIVASIGSSAQAAGDKFEIAITSVETRREGAKVTLNNVKTRTFDVAGTESPKVTVRAGTSVANPKIGDKNVEIQKFEIEGDANRKLELGQLTLRAINNDVKKNINNIRLLLDGAKIADGVMQDSYVTFRFDPKIDVDFSKILKFTINADITDGARKKIGFYFDEKLDIQGTYSGGYSIQANISDLDSSSDVREATIEAGELSIVDINPQYDEIKEGKRKVELGAMKVGNGSGGDLELQKIGVKIKLTAGQAAIQGNTAGSLTLAELFSNVYIETKEGVRFELEQPHGGQIEFVYSEDNLSHRLKEGENIFKIVADTNRNIENFNTATIQLSMTTGDLNSTTGGFYAIETVGEQPVTDITPSSISWNSIEGSESSAKASALPLSNVTKVKGANDIEALKFEVDTDSASNIDINEITLEVQANGHPATSQEISQVAIYKQEVKSANLLDRKSGSSLSTTGKISLSGFTQNIPANARETFIVTVSLVDSAAVVANAPITVKLEDLSMTDGDRQNVPYVDGVLNSNRNINVQDSGSLTITQDANNNDNKFDKVILAGNTQKVFSIDVQAENEPINLQELTFKVDKDLTKAMKNATLYLDGRVVATNSYSNNTLSGGDTIIKFNNLTNVTVPQASKELILGINTNNIGYERVGETVDNAKVTMVSILKGRGADSGKNIPTLDTPITTSKAFSVVPAIVTAEVVNRLNTGQAKVKLTVDTGNNTIASSNSKPQVKMKTFKFSELSPSSDGYSFYREGQSANRATITNTGIGDFSNFSSQDAAIISSNATYVIIPNGTDSKTYSLNLLRGGLIYDVINPDGTQIGSTVTSTLPSELDLGIKSY